MSKLSKGNVGGQVRTTEKRMSGKKLKDYETCELEQELRRRKELIFTWSRMDVKTCCDQTKGLLTDKCVDDILFKYDVEDCLSTAVTEAFEEILNDYKSSEHKLRYE